MTRKKKRPAPGSPSGSASRPPVPGFESYRDHVLAMVRNLGRTFTKPDDDWCPTLFLLSGGESYVVALAELFTDRGTKQAIPGVLDGIFRRVRPDLAGMVISAWYSRIDPDNPLAELTREMHGVFGVAASPDRQEMVVVEVADRDGQDEFWMADIVRSDKPPALAPWVKWEQGVGGAFGCVLGRVFASMKR